ncbi:guanine nucleotide-binding protein subunit beta-5b-like [Salvelinus sp. IW2-2015]|uniref:guanine nucleotide-binding protein subunit beta-5b-like n=1 Tax=Salvelinus sp. IW2-2015 TaxID=2691554 RepID=UPI0038D4A0CF
MIIAEQNAHVCQERLPSGESCEKSLKGGERTLRKKLEEERKKLHDVEVGEGAEKRKLLVKLKHEDSEDLKGHGKQGAPVMDWCKDKRRIVSSSRSGKGMRMGLLSPPIRLMQQHVVDYVGSSWRVLRPRAVAVPSAPLLGELDNRVLGGTLSHWTRTRKCRPRRKSVCQCTPNYLSGCHLHHSDHATSFEVTVNGKLAYSKLEAGGFPDTKEMVAMVKEVSRGGKVERVKKKDNKCVLQ